MRSQRFRALPSAGMVRIHLGAQDEEHQAEEVAHAGADPAREEIGAIAFAGCGRSPDRGGDHQPPRDDSDRMIRVARRADRDR